MTSYQKHHFPYNHTGSCCCHGDRRLRLYASDCLSSALCLSARGRELIWGYSCVPLRSNYHRQDGAVLLWDFSAKPGIASALHRHSAETIQPLFLIRGSYCSPGENLCGHSSRSHVRVFLKNAALKVETGGLWSSEHDSSLILFLKSAFTLRWCEA